jgi:hypothetical protein
MEIDNKVSSMEWTETDFHHYTLMLSAEDNLQKCLRLANEYGIPKVKKVLSEVELNFAYLSKRDVPVLVQIGVSQNLLKVPFSKLKKTLEILHQFMTPQELQSLRFWPEAFPSYEDFYVQYEMSKAQLYKAA